jgi:A/G-specific adenine glycosylase
MICPWRDSCQALALGVAETLPRKAEKVARPHRAGVAFWVADSNGAVLLRRREEKGLLGGMMEVPSTAWAATAPLHPEGPVEADWRVLPGHVRHVFTHFELTLTVWTARIARGDPKAGIWVKPERFGDYALPSLMMKVARHALAKS